MDFSAPGAKVINEGFQDGRRIRPAPSVSTEAEAKESFEVGGFAWWFTGARPGAPACPAGVDSGSPGPSPPAANTSATPTSGPTTPAPPARFGCHPRPCAE